MKILAFTLTMPNPPSWNGKWSGQDKPHVLIRRVSDSKAEHVIQGLPYSHLWSDGWCARIGVRVVEAKEARRLRSATAGFRGYSWMVENILAHGNPSGPDGEDQSCRKNC